MMTVTKKVIELGGSGCIPNGNWMWALSLPNIESMDKLIAWFKENDYEYGTPVRIRGSYDIRYSK